MIMHRELPESELSENSDYERWYFEGQPTVWEVEGKEVDKGREQPKTEHALFLSGGMKRETPRGLPPHKILILIPRSETLIRKHTRSALEDSTEKESQADGVVHGFQPPHSTMMRPYLAPVGCCIATASERQTYSDFRHCTWQGKFGIGGRVTSEFTAAYQSELCTDMLLWRGIFHGVSSGKY
jgi:hypothetical protein